MITTERLHCACNANQTASICSSGIRAAEFDVAGLKHPIEIYLKAAEEGFIVSQFMVGLAHLEGYRVGKNGRSAYSWLRMAEENSSGLRNRTHALIGEFKGTMKPNEVEALERSVATGVRPNKVPASKRPAERIN